MSFRTNVLRAAVVALGSALAIPALAQTDAAPVPGITEGSAYGAYQGPAAAPQSGRDAGWNIANEPGFVPNARGAFGAYAGRSPLASLDPNRATDAYGAALSEATN